MDNRFLKSLTTKLEEVNFKETFYEFSEIVIPIPNMLVDDNDPLVDIIEDTTIREEAKKFLKFSGILNRKEEIAIDVNLENTTEKTTKGDITMINIVFKVHKDFDYNTFKDIVGNKK